MTSNKLYYLASPFSHELDSVREARFETAVYVTDRLLKLGVNVFSPIVHSHPIDCRTGKKDWQFWAPLDHSILSRCDELLVLLTPGWYESVGVADEVRWATELGIPISIVDVTECRPQAMSRKLIDHFVESSKGKEREDG